MKKSYEFPCGCKFDVLQELKGYKMPLLDFSYEKINWNCPAVWELAKTGRSLGIFQLESNIGRKYLKELEPESIEHFSALGALLRPGALGSLDDTGKNLCQKYCDRKQFREPVDIEFPALEHILKDTYGIMVFQENIIAISQEICGFSASKADDLRKGVSKKDAAKLFGLEQSFVDGAEKVGKITRDDATKIFGWIKNASRYSFNRCLHKNTKCIERTKGEVGIKDIFIGDYVLCPTKNSLWESQWVKVTGWHYQKKRFLFHVVLNSGKHKTFIQCTANHKFMTFNREILPLYDIIKRYGYIFGENYSLYKIEQVIPIGIDDTYDITIDSDEHVFLANSLITSNSHSTLYAIRSYVDFYLKSHFPLQFYTAKLKSPRKSTETEDIVNMIYEAKVIGIETKLPDIRDMRPVFYNDGKYIYFGLTDINGYGESSFVKLSNVVQEDNSILHNFYEFAINSLFKLTESSTCSLIESGALDWTGITRALMLEEFKLLSGLTKGEKEKLGKYLQAQKSGVFNE